MTAVTSRTVKLPSLRMHLLEAGPAEGPLVILLHGFPELSDSWREVMPTIAAAGFHVVAPDLRGYGGTDRPKDGYDLDRLAADIRELAEHLQPGRPAHVVGHDWGGGIAFHLAAMHPEVVDKLTVINGPHPAVLSRQVWHPAQLVRFWYMFLFQLPWLPERMLSSRGGALVKKTFSDFLVDKSRLSNERINAYAEHFTQPGAATAAINYYRRYLRDEVLSSKGRQRMKNYPRIKAPFLLIWAEEDRALRRELTYNLEPWFESPPRVHSLPGVGHFAPIEAPDKVASLVLEHVGGQAPRA